MMELYKDDWGNDVAYVEKIISENFESKLLSWYVNEWDHADDFSDLEYHINEVSCYNGKISFEILLDEGIPENYEKKLVEFVENITENLLGYAESMLECVSEDEEISYVEILENY